MPFSIGVAPVTFVGLAIGFATHLTDLGVPMQRFLVIASASEAIQLYRSKAGLLRRLRSSQ
jgi:hypothetical protein